jgi:flagella basal body P-ring formation protein FlgA
MTLSFMITITVLMSAWIWGVIGAAGEAAAHPSGQRTAAETQGSERVKERGRARSSQAIQPDQIRRAIQIHLQRELAGKVQEIRVTVGEPQQPIVVPAGMLRLSVDPADIGEHVGRRVFQVHVAVNGTFHRTVEAITDVTAYVDLVAPVRLIKTDEEIEADDVVTTRVALSDLRLPYARDPRDVVGKAATRPLSPQAPIRLTALRRPFVVRKGDRVMIEAKMGGLSIQTSGVTKGNGELGQTITVSNTDSGKDLRAKVVGPGVVRVDF